jgi:hypothetical protein
MTTPYDRIHAPASIVVLTSKACPHCAHVVEQVEDLQRRCPSIQSSVLDVLAEDAQPLRIAHGVQSVPATLLDDDIMIQGQVTARRLAEILASRGTPDYDTHKMRALLDARRVEDASEFLRLPGRACCVLPILATAELSDRMGATLVIQLAQEASPGSLADLVPGLIALLSSDNPSLRGDVADLLGTLGDPRAIPALEALSTDPNEDVVAAATDALEAIRGG